MHVRRSKAQDCRDNGVKDVVGRNNEKPHGAVVPFGQSRHLREESPFGGCWGRVVEAIGADVDAQQPDGHRYHISITRCLQRACHMGERMWVANEHQHIAWTSVHLVEGELSGGQDVEGISVFSHDRRKVLAAASCKQEHEASHQRERRDSRRIARDDHRHCSGTDQQDGNQ